MPAPDGLAIGEVSALLGVPVPTLRSWHLRYGVAQPPRTAGGHRRYRPDEVRLLQALSTAVSRGIAPGTAAQSLRGLGADGPEPLPLLTRLLEAVDAGDQSGFTRVLDSAERELGVEDAIDRLLVPTLREVGLRWAGGAIDVGHEHLATAAARDWIARRTGRTPALDTRPVLLAGGPGNRHTVALEAFAMLLERRGWPLCRLGGDTPVPAVLTALQAAGAQAAVVTAQQVSRRRPTVEVLAALSRQPGLRLYYAGAAFDSPRARRDVPGTYLGTVLPAAVDRVTGELDAGA